MVGCRHNRDDRGQLRENVAKFSTYELAEKFLAWHWASTARNVLRHPSLGPELYSLGIALNVEAIALAEGIYELRAAEGRAVLLEPEATIFSHPMSKSINEIENIGKAGVDSWGTSDPRTTKPKKQVRGPMSNFARLAEHWINWTQLSGTTDVSVSEADKDCLIRFKSADGSFFLRREGTWWVIDEVDDHGKRYADTTRFSTFELAEKYLIWTWGSVARSVLRAEQLGVRLNSLGMAPGVSVEPTDREYVVELHAATGVAILPLSGATIASHWMTLSIEEVEQMLEAGLG